MSAEERGVLLGEMEPGDVIDNPVLPSVLLSVADHPLWEGFKLVLWWMDSSYVVDSLRLEDEVGGGPLLLQSPHDRRLLLERIARDWGGYKP